MQTSFPKTQLRVFRNSPHPANSPKLIGLILELARGRGIPLLAFALPFALYLATLAPTIYNLDSAELTIAASTGGLMRATGYPLYLLLGRLWSYLPLGDVGYRFNLFSAFNGALAVFLGCRILRKLGVGNLAAFGALGLMATAPFYWSLSLVAEVYTLHVVLMAGLILLLLHWAEAASPGRLALAAGWLGLSMGHHLATALLAPGVVFFVVSHARRKAFAWGNILFAVGAFIAGLSIYLYLPLLHAGAPAFNYSGMYDSAGHFHPVNLQSAAGLWWLVTGKSFASQMFAYHGAGLWREVGWFAGHLARAFLFVGIGPGVFGLAVLFRRDWRLGGMLALMFSVSAFFYIDYLVVDKETMFLPAYLGWALFAGVGCEALLEGQGTPRAGQIPWGRRLLETGMVAAVFIAGFWTGPQVNLSNDWSTRERGEEILALVWQDAVIFGWWDSIPPVQYLQLVEGARPDVLAINRFLIGQEDMFQFALREAAHRPVYVDSFPAEWGSVLRAVPAGPLYRVIVRVTPGGERYGYAEAVAR